MKSIVFLLFLALASTASAARFLQLFNNLEAESTNPNGFHTGDATVNLPTPSIMDYVKDSANDTFSFKQIPDDVPALSIIIPKNDDYMKNAFTETAVDITSLENQAKSLIGEQSGGEHNNMEMGTALLKTKEFIEKALKKDLNVGVSKKDLMNLLSFSNKILDKCQGNFMNCQIEKKSQDGESKDGEIKDADVMKDIEGNDRSSKYFKDIEGKDGENKDENKDGENKDGENKDGENKDGENKDGENKDGENKDGENKDGENKDGENKDGANKDENKDGENKDGENKDGENKDGENKDGENKDGENKDGENKNHHHSTHKKTHHSK